jgi:hypothetical protein
MRTNRVEIAWEKLADAMDHAPLEVLAAAGRGEDVFPHIRAELGAEVVQRACIEYLPLRGADADGQYVGFEEALRRFLSSPEGARFRVGTVR